MNAEAYKGTLVVGGGPAGSAAAIWLARAGWPVTIWEKERFARHRICGEFLSWEALTYLRDLGVDPETLGAVPIERMRVITASRIAEGELGFRGLSLTRKLLDEALLKAAEASGAIVRRGITAREISPEGHVVEGHKVMAPANLLLATGKHNLRGVARNGEGTLSQLLGFKTYFRLTREQRAELSGHVELTHFAGGYAGLQMVEQDSANLCFLVSPDRWKRLGGDFEALLSELGREVPHLARRLSGAVNLLDRPLAIAGVPYGFMHRPAHGSDEPGWRLGDQAAVIPSFTGDGMSLALHSAKLATATLMTGAGKAHYYKRLRGDARGAVQRAIWLQKAAGLEGWANAGAAIAQWVPGVLKVAIGSTRLSRAAVDRALAM